MKKGTGILNIIGIIGVIYFIGYVIFSLQGNTNSASSGVSIPCENNISGNMIKISDMGCTADFWDTISKWHAKVNFTVENLRPVAVEGSPYVIIRAYGENNKILDDHRVYLFDLPANSKKDYDASLDTTEKPVKIIIGDDN